MARPLHEDPQVTVTLEPAAALVRYHRSRTPYPSLDAVREQHGRLLDALTGLPPGKLGLLVDVREAPARNDDAFEAEITRALRSIMPRFSGHAVLVKSAVGKLQAQRLAKTRGDGSLSVFSDEAEALAHLRSAVSS